MKDDERDEDLSDEDLALKQRLEVYVDRVQHSDPEQQKVALENMRQEIRDTKSSVSVLKPLKFLRPHYGTLQSHYEKVEDSDLKKLLADILSVLASTMSPHGERANLKYRLLGSVGDICSWGHEYVRDLAGEISQEYEKRLDENAKCNDLNDLVEEIVPFYLKHNAEAEAVDLSLESDRLEPIEKNVDDANYERTCLYLTSFMKHYTDPEVMSYIPSFAYSIYKKFKDYPRALQIAMCMDDMKYVKQIFIDCNDLQRKQQFCFMIARHGFEFMLDKEMCEDDEERKALQKITDGIKLNEGYLTLARDLEVMDPKTPLDIYKTDQLDDSGSCGLTVDRQILAAAFVNAFVNAGFGQDNLMSVPADSSISSSLTSWLSENMEHLNTSVAASLGMILLWDVDSGLAQLGKYFDYTNSHVRAGILLGVGIVNCNVKHGLSSMDRLEKYVEHEDSSIKIGAIMGIGLAYAGLRDEKMGNVFMDILKDEKSSLDVIAFTTISLGLLYVGSCEEKVVDAIIYALKCRSASDLKEPLIRFLPLGLGLVFLGKQDGVNAKTFKPEIRKYCEMTLLSCAYAGTGNVLKIQYFLRHCAGRNGTHQGTAVIGIAMVAMSEELGLDMAIRLMEHLFKYGELNIRRAVPLALGLLCISNPKINVMDTLSRLSHDADAEVALAAIISLGLIGAGTNNARIAGMLRKLSSYYYEDESLLFSVRIAQGLVHMGKGLLTLSPYHSERFLLSPTALAGVVTLLHACLDMKDIILGKYHFVLYFLVLAMQPRMLMTLDENLKPLSVPVRVGQAVDVVGQPGQPKTITGFQTLSTPILLSAGDKAELVTEKYIPLSPFLKGFVILRENPESIEDQ